MKRWKTIYRYPAKGRPAIFILESPNAFMMKLPIWSNVEHLLITKEQGTVEIHLTDEVENSHEPLGKNNSGEAQHGRELLKLYSVEAADDEIVYIPPSVLSPRTRRRDRSDRPASGSATDRSLSHLRRIRLPGSVVPFGPAPRRGMPGGSVRPSERSSGRGSFSPPRTRSSHRPPRPMRSCRAARPGRR